MSETRRKAPACAVPVRLCSSAAQRGSRRPPEPPPSAPERRWFFLCSCLTRTVFPDSPATPRSRSCFRFVSPVLGQGLKITGSQREVLYKLEGGVFFKIWGPERNALKLNQ